MSYLLYRLDATQAHLRAEPLHQGLRRHLSVASLLSVVMQIGQRQQAYVALVGCSGCAIDRCEPGCRVELLRRTARSAFGGSGALHHVAKGLAPRPYTRIVLARPRSAARMLESDLLHPYRDARLTVHWHTSAKGPLRLSAVLAVSADGPDPAVELRERGWQTWTIPGALLRLARARFCATIPSGLPIAGQWPSDPALLLVTSVPAVTQTPAVAPAPPLHTEMLIGERETQAAKPEIDEPVTPVGGEGEGGAREAIEEAEPVVAGEEAVDASLSIEHVGAEEAAAATELIAASAHPFVHVGMPDALLGTSDSLAIVAERQERAALRQTAYVHLKEILEGRSTLQRQPSLAMADTAAPIEGGQAAIAVISEEESPWPEGPGEGKATMYPADVEAFVLAALASDDITRGGELGLTRKRVAALLIERHKEHAGPILLWFETAGLLEQPLDDHQPYRRPRPLTCMDAAIIAERLKATPRPTADAMTAAKAKGL